MKDQFSYHQKKKLLLSLRTIFMLISGSTRDYYKIFNTDGGNDSAEFAIVPKFEGWMFVCECVCVFYSSGSPWRNF